MYSIKDGLSLIKLKLLELRNKGYFFSFNAINKENPKEMINFVLISHSSHVFKFKFYVLCFLVIKGHFDMFGPSNITPNAWNREATFPKSLSLLI